MEHPTEERRSRGNDLLRAVIDTTVDAMIIVDRMGVVRIFNPAACALFGYTSDEVVGRDVAMLMPPGDRENHGHYMRRYGETGQRRIIGRGREVNGRRKNGTVFPMTLAVGEIRDGNEFAFVGIIRDLTAQKRSDAALAAARSQAELASAAKTQFLSRMSHELRTPMNAVLGFAQLLRASRPGEVSEAIYDDYLDTIVLASKHLVSLIDDILEFARVENGALKFDCRALDLADVAAGAIRMTQPTAERRGITVVNGLAVGAEALMVQADPVRLRECIVNLLSNAIKYNRAAGRVFLETHDTRRSEGFLRLAVTDTGVGIAEAQIPDLFQPFARLHPELEHVEGAGIGLAITKQLIEAMGGAISAKSTVGRGSSFFLDIPLVMTAARPEAEAVLGVEENPETMRLMESPGRR